MTIQKEIYCDECGIELSDMEAARKHEEKNCMPWEIDDRVLFEYRLLSFPGTITGLGSLVGSGEERMVHIESDEQVEDADWSQAHSGKDFYIGISALQKLEEEDGLEKTQSF